MRDHVIHFYGFRKTTATKFMKILDEAGVKTEQIDVYVHPADDVDVKVGSGRTDSKLKRDIADTVELQRQRQRRRHRQQKRAAADGALTDGN